MAYSDADLLNMFKAYSYGSSAAEVQIQGLNSSDQARFASLAQGDWNAQKTDGDANAIINLSNKGLISFNTSLVSDAYAYRDLKNRTELSNTIAPVNIPITDSSQLSTTSDNSKFSNAVANGGVTNTANSNSSTPSNASITSSANLIKSTSSNTSATALSVSTPIIPQSRNDRRARLSPRAGVFDQLITPSGLMAPLIPTYGLMFPITPTITENVDVNYESYDMAHGLMPIQAYKSGGEKNLSIEATFVAQTDVEARYCLACIHFIRSFSKMNFGDSDPNAGTPPPILVFNAYGDAMFHNLPVIIKSASFQWPNDVDYVYTTASSPATTSTRNLSAMVADGWVPSKFNVSITLTVQQTPARLRKFNLEAFRNGTLLTGNGGWI